MRLLSLLLVSCSLSGYSQPSHVVTSVFGTGSGQDYITSVQYSDGLNRPLQSCTFSSGTINNFTLYSGIYYDSTGRQFLTTLPLVDLSKRVSFISMDQAGVAAGNYSNCGFMTQVMSYYSVSGRNAQGYPFSQTKYYNDPLSRIKASGSPGRPYSLHTTLGHPSKVWYFPTKPGLTGRSLIDTNGFFTSTGLQYVDDYTAENIGISDPTHFLTITSDPDGNFTQVIKNIFGNVVKTWADPKNSDGPVISSNRYDLAGHILEETPPRGDAVEQWTESTKYNYSTDGSLASKLSPDAGEVKYKYDSPGRLKCVQDEVARANESQGYYQNTYLVYNYDVLGRIKEIGTNTINVSFGNLSEADLDADLSVNCKIRYFYDTPEMINTYIPSSYIGDTYRFIGREFKNLRGNLVVSIAYDETGIKTPAHSVVKLYTYDNENRVKADYLYIGCENVMRKTSYTYSLTGKVTSLYVYHKFGSSTTMHDENFLYIYDASDRPDKVYVNGNLKISYTYDSLGRMNGKNFYDNSATTPQVIKHLDYKYTLQGQLKKIQSDDSKFGEELYYDDIAEAGFTAGTGTALYNGNISGLKAQQNYQSVTNNTFQTGFEYTYDGISRLTGVDEMTGKNSYDEAFSFYKDGRLRGKYTGVPFVTGPRRYNYNMGKNQLNYIQFDPIRGKVDNYIYDRNGNMIADCVKSMVIEYDWRNMPVRFTFFLTFPSDMAMMKSNASSSQKLATYIRTTCQRVSFVEMVYDADGNRVKKAEFAD